MTEVKIDLDKNIQTIDHNAKQYKIIVQAIDDKYCICGCGNKTMSSHSKYYSNACRTRMYRQRKAAK